MRETTSVGSEATVWTKNLFSGFQTHMIFIFFSLCGHKKLSVVGKPSLLLLLLRPFFSHLPSPYAHHSPSTLLIGYAGQLISHCVSLLSPLWPFFLFPPPSNMYKSHMEGLLLISTCWDFHLFSLSRDLTMQPALPKTH